MQVSSAEQPIGNLQGLSGVWDDSGLNAKFADRSDEEFAIAIVGDIHLEPGQMHLFDAARVQLKDAVTSSGNPAPRLVQLGDLGGYDYGPGGWQCFKVVREYLESFGVPKAIVAGNHDLEGEEFESDEENLLAWQQAFQQRHYWSAQLGSVLLLGLSTIKFRSNKNSVHEVHIDDGQIAWFQKQLEASNGAPVIVFTHAPAMGSGLRTVEGVHVKNRCAWLNHSGNSGAFIDLVQKHPNIKLWFSGHYHLSQNYPNSISVRNQCSFVQVGVIGNCGRDGQHQSRILRGDSSGFRLYTMDHATGQERLDLAQGWTQPPQAKVQEEYWPSKLPFQASSSAVSGPPSDNASVDPDSKEAWYGAGDFCVLRRTGKLLIEYNAKYRAAVGTVFTDLEEDHLVRLVDASGNVVRSMQDAQNDPMEDGSSAVAVQVLDASGEVVRSQGRNSEGTFFQIFQQNKWRAQQLQRQKESLQPR